MISQAPWLLFSDNLFDRYAPNVRSCLVYANCLFAAMHHQLDCYKRDLIVYEIVPYHRYLKCIEHGRHANIMVHKMPNAMSKTVQN